MQDAPKVKIKVIVAGRGDAVADLLGYSSRSAVLQGAPHLRFAELQVKDLAYTRRAGVLYRKDAYLSPAAKRFIEILKATAKEIATENR